MKEKEGIEQQIKHLEKLIKENVDKSIILEEKRKLDNLLNQYLKDL